MAGTNFIDDQDDFCGAAWAHDGRMISYVAMSLLKSNNIIVMNANM